MKKMFSYSPYIVLLFVLLIFLGLIFPQTEEIKITTSTLTEVIKTAKITTAKYIQHGIAKAHIDGKEDGFVLYYAIVKPNVNLNEIEYVVDHDKKTVFVILPDVFSFDVELIEDEEHKFYYYPEDIDEWTAKDVAYICEIDARQKAEANAVLIDDARASLINTIEVLLDPILRGNDYTLNIQFGSVVG